MQSDCVDSSIMQKCFLNQITIHSVFKAKQDDNVFPQQPIFFFSFFHFLTPFFVLINFLLNDFSITNQNLIFNNQNSRRLFATSEGGQENLQQAVLLAGNWSTN
eukprot:TRINITY_DN5460_c0_g1_i4.p4 TRINITY_DN5460_c0_g1~~TRINITY_DN5460_c0_g1_i4.p4  ORF type:complete len:104 (+),score=5.48 TRINITY_DN5460_c0_g1_i4:559-870(+)